MASTEFIIRVEIISDKDDTKIPDKSHQKIQELSDASFKILGILGIPSESEVDIEHRQAIVCTPTKPKANVSAKLLDDEGNMLIEWSIEGQFDKAELSFGKKTETVERKGSRNFNAKKTTPYSLLVVGQAGSDTISSEIEIPEKEEKSNDTES